MDLRHLDVLVVIAQERGVTAAARRLRISQPALSQLLGRIERELGFSVFDRSSSPLGITPEGARFLRAASEISQLYSDALHTSRGTATARSVTIGAAPRMARNIFPAIASARNREEHVDLDVRLVEASSLELHSLVSRGVVDLAVLSAPALGDGFLFAPVLSSGFLVASRASSADAVVTGPALAAMLQDAELLLPQVGGVRTHLQPYLDRLDGLRLGVESSSTETLLGLVEIGQGVAIVPEIVVTEPDRRRFPDVHFARLVDGPPPFETGIVSRGSPSDEHQEHALRLVRSALLSRFVQFALDRSWAS